jgi:GR25 family glycosyltransferase involved in LPS biosynthesis
VSIPIYCINLESSKDRKKTIEKQWIEKYGFNISFWTAVDKTDPIIQKINKNTSKVNRPLMDGEVALILSYISLAEHIIKNNIKEVIIMEDDVFPNPVFDFMSNINIPNLMFSYIQKCKNEFEKLSILLMHRPACSNKFKIKKEFDHCYSLITPPYGAQMNYYTNSGIQKMYNNLKNNELIVDQYAKMQYLMNTIALSKHPFCFHYEERAVSTHPKYNSDIGR